MSSRAVDEQMIDAGLGAEDAALAQRKSAFVREFILRLPFIFPEGDGDRDCMIQVAEERFARLEVKGYA